MKVCKTCKVKKDLSYFYANSSGGTTLSCRACIIKKQKLPSKPIVKRYKDYLKESGQYERYLDLKSLGMIS